MKGSAVAPASSGATILDILAAASSSTSIGLATDLDGGLHEMSPDEMLTRGRAAAARLQGLGVRPGDRVVALVPTSPEFVALLVGAWMSSAVIVPLAGPPPRLGLPRYRERLRSILEVTRPRVVVGNDRALAQVYESGAELTGTMLLPAASIEAETPVAGPGAFPDARDPALLQCTSGSTGTVRAAIIRHGQIVGNNRSLGRRAGTTADDRWLSWLPLYHDMGFVAGLLYPVVWGIRSRLIPTEMFIRNPGFWLTSMTEFRGSLCPAPPFAYELLAEQVSDRRLEGVDLSSWRYAWVGAEQVFPRVLRAFQDRFGGMGLPETTLHPAYGLAEATLAVSHAHPDERFRAEWVDRRALRAEGLAAPAAPDADDAVPITSNGTPLDDTEVAIRDASGATLPERREGVVHVRSPNVTSGYYHRQDEPPVRDGWLDTGDLGFLANGEVFITGRQKDILIRGGENLRPAEIESVASEVPGVRAGRVAAVAVPHHETGHEEIVVVAEATTKDDGLPLRIQQEVARKAGLQLDRVVIVPRNAIPRTSSGKIQRSTCRELVPDPPEGDG